MDSLQQALADKIPLLSRLDGDDQEDNTVKARAIELLIQWERQGEDFLGTLEAEFAFVYRRCSEEREAILRQGKNGEGYQEELLVGTVLCRRMIVCVQRLQKGLQKVGTEKAKQLYLQIVRIQKKPIHLKALLKMCDCTVQWGYVRCSSLCRLMEFMDDPALVQLQLSVGDEEEERTEYFLYLVIECLAKFLRDEKTLGKRSGWQKEMHDHSVCCNCWVVAMTLLMQALDQSQQFLDPRRVIQDSLSKYQWYILFPTVEEYSARQFEQHFTVYLNLWKELHRMACLVVMDDGFSPLEQRSPAKDLLQFDLGNCCTGLLECMLRMIAHGKAFQAEEDPEQLAGILCGSFEFMLAFNLCWTHRQPKAQTTNLRHRARASLLRLMVDKGSVWRSKGTSTLEHCYRLACMLKDSTWSRFNEEMREDIQWKLLKTLMMEPTQDKTSPEMQQKRKCLTVAIGYSEAKCAACWKTDEDLRFLVAHPSTKKKNNNNRGKKKKNNNNNSSSSSSKGSTTNHCELVACTTCESRMVCSHGSCQDRHVKLNCPGKSPLHDID